MPRSPVVSDQPSSRIRPWRLPTRVTTSRAMFQRVALCRNEEARILFAAKQYGGAYYLAGYAIECALKAVICCQFQRHTLPSKKLVFDSFDHDLEKLLAVAGLKTDHDVTRKNDPIFELNWSIIREWRPESRYRTHTKDAAKDLIEAVGQGPSSFIDWVQTRW